MRAAALVCTNPKRTLMLCKTHAFPESIIPHGYRTVMG